MLFDLLDRVFCNLYEPSKNQSGIISLGVAENFLCHEELVTFLLAAENYPAPIRSTAHGFSAAIGKLGALAPTILYNYIDNQNKFGLSHGLALLDSHSKCYSFPILQV